MNGSTRLTLGVLALAACFAGPAMSQTWHDVPDATRQSLRRLADDLHGDYLYPDMSLTSAFHEAMGGPPEQTVRLADGRTLISGCRLHSCTEKAAVVIDAPGAVRAAGLIHYNVTDRGRARRGSGAADAAMLTVADDGEDTSGRAPLLAWARAIVPELRTVEYVTRVDRR